MILLAVYLGAGLIALIIMEILTRKFSKNISNASLNAQQKLAEQGTYTTPKAAKIITLVFTLIFWPVPVFGNLIEKLFNKLKAGINES